VANREACGGEDQDKPVGEMTMIPDFLPPPGELMVPTKRKFDAVKFQREVREGLSREYLADPEGFVRKLRERYGRSGRRKGATKG